MWDGVAREAGVRIFASLRFHVEKTIWACLSKWKLFPGYISKGFSLSSCQKHEEIFHGSLLWELGAALDVYNLSFPIHSWIWEFLNPGASAPSKLWFCIFACPLSFGSISLHCNFNSFNRSKKNYWPYSLLGFFVVVVRIVVMTSNIFTCQSRKIV